MKNKRLFFLAFLGVAAVFLLIYHGALDNYFFQDDFYFLRLSRAESFLDFLKFFSPWHQQGFPAYRPLGTQVYFFFGQLFPAFASPYIMRGILFLFHFLNFLLVFKILKKLLKKDWLALILAALYLNAPLHFLSLYYLAAFQQVLAAFFQLLGFYLYLKNKKKAVYFCYLEALLAKETAIFFPVLLLIFKTLVYFDKNKSFKNIKNEIIGEKRYWLGFVFLAFAYALLRLLSFSQSPGEEYQLSLTPKTFFSSLRWYLIWLVGAPETIINYAQGGINFSVAKFINDAGISAYFFGGLFLAEFIVLCLILINLGRKKKDRRQVALFLLLGLAVMIISLSSVIFMPYHRFAHYLDLSLFLFLVVLGLLVKREKGLTLTLVFIFALLFLANAFFCVRIDEKLHWAPARSKIAAKYQEFFKNEGACNNRQGIYFIDTKSNLAKEVAIALSFADGPRYFCQNYDLPVFYQELVEPNEKEKQQLLIISSGN